MRAQLHWWPRDLSKADRVFSLTKMLLLDQSFRGDKDCFVPERRGSKPIPESTLLGLAD